MDVTRAEWLTNLAALSISCLRKRCCEASVLTDTWADCDDDDDPAAAAAAASVATDDDDDDADGCAALWAGCNGAADANADVDECSFCWCRDTFGLASCVAPLGAWSLCPLQTFTNNLSV